MTSIFPHMKCAFPHGKPYVPLPRCVSIRSINSHACVGCRAPPILTSAQSGMWMGLLLMGLAAFLSNRSSNMLIAMGEKSGRLNYEDLMSTVFGNAGIHAFCFFAGVLAFGSMSSYLIIVGDTVPEILLASGITTGVFADRHSVIGLFGVFCMLPVSLLRDMSMLAYTSLLSISADGILTLIVVYSAAVETRYDAECALGSGKLAVIASTGLSFGTISPATLGLVLANASHMDQTECLCACFSQEKLK